MDMQIDTTLCDSIACTVGNSLSRRYCLRWRNDSVSSGLMKLCSIAVMQ